MRGKLLVLSVGLVVGAFAVYLLTCGGAATVSADCPGDPGKPCGPGDVNASGGIDIADAIYLLGYLFKQGPAPAAIECSGGVLPATGQTKCYMPMGEIACESMGISGRQDAFYQKGCPMANRFTDNGDGTVTDTCTGLMWQKETAPGTYDQVNAITYCEDLELGGHSDWRLPNVRELESLVDYGRTDPCIDPVFSAVVDLYWSSTIAPGGMEGMKAWSVAFLYGEVTRQLLLHVESSVRAVRG